MSDRPDNVIHLPQVSKPESEPKKITTEAELVKFFEALQKQIAKIDTVEEAIKTRTKAELYQLLAKKIGCTKETLEQVAILKVKAERRLGQLLQEKPESRGGDHKSEDYQKSKVDGSTFDPPTLENLGIKKHIAVRSKLIANIPDKLFKDRIEYTQKHLNRGRDLTAEMYDYAKYLKREQDRQERREEAASRAAESEPDERIKILHGDFRKVLDCVPDKTVDLIVTDPSYIRKDGTYLDLWYGLSEVAARLLKPETGLLLCYSGKFCLPEAINALSEHLRYVWTAAVLYEGFPDTIHRLRFKTYFKPLLIYTSKDAEYQPHQTQYWFKDIIQGDGYRGLKSHHPWEQGVSEAMYVIENLSYENDLVVDPFLGSGTTAVAAKRLNRRFVGCDESLDAVQITLSRLSQEPEPNESNRQRQGDTPSAS